MVARVVADDVREDLAALALPVGTHAPQVLVHVVGVAEADRLDLDDPVHEGLAHRVTPRQVEEIERELLQVGVVLGGGEVATQRLRAACLEVGDDRFVVGVADLLHRCVDLRVHVCGSCFSELSLAVTA
jgi:hypothetical protein